MKKTGLDGYVYDFSVDYDSIDVDYILDIHKYYINITMFGFFINLFIALLSASTTGSFDESLT